MRAIMLGLAALAALASCGRPGGTGANGPNVRGRFAGIGTFDAGRMWSHMATATPADPAVARLADDEHVIVVVDSVSGEIRQCGDHSGYCVAMDPWHGTAAASLPARLDRHAADLDAEAKQEADAGGK